MGGNEGADACGESQEKILVWPYCLHLAWLKGWCCIKLKQIYLICLSTKIVHISLGSLELAKCLENLKQNNFEVYPQSDQNTN